MIAAHWTLLITLIFPNGQQQELSDHYVQKQYCIEAGQQFWRKYWTGPSTDRYKVFMICRNKKNNYDFERIDCDKAGVCKTKF